MATVVNNPPRNENSGGGGFLIGMILIVIFVILFIFYGLPFLQGSGGGTQSGGTEVQVPEQVDVNVNQNPNN